MSQSITTTLPEVLKSIARPGDFCVSGVAELAAPNLTVAGVGLISLPLLPLQRDQLVAVSEQAPYGRGVETLVDTAVRRTWQIAADHLQFAGRRWAQSLAAIVAQAAAGLGVTATVEAELYKLLIYDEGSFFVDHRDTEKRPGMFATLVLVLPSVYSGGELWVRHQGREKCMDFSQCDPAEFPWVAFYADCVHEVRPVTTGCRVALIYNLWCQGNPPAAPPSLDDPINQASALLQSWAQSPSAPQKIVYPLEHAYSQAELGFSQLKGMDQVAATTLRAAAASADCELHLALLSIVETGSADYDDGYYRDDDEYEEIDGFRLGEVFERSNVLYHWIKPDDTPWVLGEVNCNDEEFCPPNYFADDAPSDIDFHEATGNGGASFERIYHHAALVMWSRAQRTDIIARAGLAVALPYLTSLLPDFSQPQIHAEARRIAEQLIGRGSFQWHVYFDGMLGVLNNLGDDNLLHHWITSLWASPSAYPFDTVIIPALLKRRPGPWLPAARQLLDAALSFLSARMSEPLTAPVNAVRDTLSPCNCADCTALNAFLQHPTLTRWELQAVENRRRHLEQAIRGSPCDVDCTTSKKQRPHSLVCIKNQASYQRRTAQRARDQQSLAGLTALVS